MKYYFCFYDNKLTLSSKLYYPSISCEYLTAKGLAEESLHNVQFVAPEQNCSQRTEMLV